MSQTPDQSLRSILSGVLGNRCPRCSKGQVFRWVYGMNERCPSCGFKFEREDGYFLGAMVLGYLFGALSVVPTLVVLLFILKLPMALVLGLACLQVLLLNPPIFMYGRLAWIYLDHRTEERLR